MKNPLRKRYSRDLRKNRGRYLSIFTMLMVTIGLMSGFLAVSDGVQEALWDNRKVSKVEDGQFASYTEIDEDIIEHVEELGISIYENYYIDVKIEENIQDDQLDQLKDSKQRDAQDDDNNSDNNNNNSDNNNKKMALRIYKDRKGTNLVTVMRGALPSKNNEIALERLFAANNKLEIGDIVTVSGTDMKVTGYVSVPDYSSLFEKNSNLIMDSFHFGIGIVTDEAFEQYSNNSVIFNYSYYYNERSLTEREKRELSDQVLEHLVTNKVLLTNFLTADTNNSITFIDDDMGSDVPLMNMVLNIIIIIMAFVYSIVISSTIDSEASIIGTLLASGYGKYELIRHYMGLPVIVTITSAIIGNLLGYTVMPSFFHNMYYSSYSLPPMEVRLNLEALFLTTVLPVLIMVVINFLTLNRKMSISPLNFLRKELHRNKNRRAIKLPNISFMKRFRMRVMIQNKSNYLTLFIGIFLANVILMFGLAINPLINHYVDSIKSTAISQYQYILKTPMESEQEGLGEKFTFASLETFYKPANKNIEVSFYGVTEETEYLSDLPLANNEQGAYFSDGLVKKLKKEIGDEVVFSDPYTGEEYKVIIKGIHPYSAGLAVFINQGQMNILLNLEEGYYNGYFSDERLTFSDENNLAATIKPEDMVELGTQMSTSFSQLAPLCLGIAVIIYLVLMYLLTKIVIEKNALSMSFMKVFGYEEKEIKKLYLTPTTIVVVASLLVGLPLAYLAIKFCFELVLMKISGYIAVYVPWYLFGEIVVIGLVVYFIINYYHKKKVYGIEMAAALKNKE